MQRSFVLGMLLLSSGCPEIGRITYRFDLPSGSGSLEFEDIGTDSPSSAASDFAEIVNDWLLGSKVQDEHPSWRVGERKLLEREGRLDGLVLFTFDRPADAGLYQYDRKSPYLWCAGEEELVVSTNGTVVPTYPSCVFFDRKIKRVEVTVTKGDSTGGRSSLLPQYQVWDGGPIDAGAFGLEQIGDMFGEALKGALGGDPTDPGFDLGRLLPETEPRAEWSALGLPIEGGKVVSSDDKRIQVAHAQLSMADAMSRYGDALKAAGYTLAAAKGEEAVWEKGADRLTLVATQAGSTVIVSLAR